MSKTYHGGEIVMQIIINKLELAIIIIILVVIGAVVVYCHGIDSVEKQTTVPNVKIPVETVVPTVVPTTTPVPTYVTHERELHAVPTSSPKYRPTTKSTDSVVWGNIGGYLSPDDVGYWMGRQNTFWKDGSREIIYQMIAFFVKDYRKKVFIKSGTFREIVFSDKNGEVYRAENVLIGDLSEEKVTIYATSFTNMNDGTKKITFAFFFDAEDDDLIAFAYGPAESIVTEPNYVSGGESGGGPGGSGGNTGNSPGGSGGNTGGSGFGGVGW